MPTIQALVDAVDARAASSVFYTYTEGQARPAQPPGPYAVLEYSGGWAYSTNLAAVPTDLRWDFTARCCGYSRNQAITVADLMRAKFRRWRPFGHPGPMFVEIDNGAPLITDESDPDDIRSSITLSYRLQTRS